MFPLPLSQLTKSRPKGPANRKLPTQRLSPLSPPSADSHSSLETVDDGGEGEREEMKKEGEREERRGEGGEKEEVDGLAVPGIRRHRRSPRRERKRKVCSF